MISSRSVPVRSLLLWRLGFEFENIRRAVYTNARCELYFAYGANMDAAVLRRRHITPLAEEPFTLEGYRLVFDHQAFATRDMGFANVERAPNTCTYGKLYRLSASDSARLDYYEGVPVLRRYRRVRHVVGDRSMFFYESLDRRADLRPSADYLGKIVAAYTAMGVPEEHIAALRSTKVLMSQVPVRRLPVGRPPRLPPPLAALRERFDVASTPILIKYIFRRSLTERLLP